MDDGKIGDRFQIAQKNTSLLAALTEPIWCLSPVFTQLWQTSLSVFELETFVFANLGFHHAATGGVKNLARKTRFHRHVI
jgi:hypothetical protein